MIDIKKLSFDELHELQRSINKEIVDRQEERFCELARYAAKAFNELKKEFPFVQLNITEEVNIFDYFDHLTEHNFYMG